MNVVKTKQSKRYIEENEEIMRFLGGKLYYRQNEIFYASNFSRLRANHRNYPTSYQLWMFLF